MRITTTGRFFAIRRFGSAAAIAVSNGTDCRVAELSLRIGRAWGRSRMLGVGSLLPLGR